MPIILLRAAYCSTLWTINWPLHCPTMCPCQVGREKYISKVLHENQLSIFARASVWWVGGKAQGTGSRKPQQLTWDGEQHAMELCQPYTHIWKYCKYCKYCKYLTSWDLVQQISETTSEAAPISMLSYPWCCPAWQMTNCSEVAGAIIWNWLWWILNANNKLQVDVNS